LLEQAGLSPGLASPVIDWLDPDSLPYDSEGAEEDWYLRLKPAYRNANRADGQRFRTGVAARLHGVKSRCKKSLLMSATLPAVDGHQRQHRRPDADCFIK
jgi:hypothetical protein